MAAAWVFAGLAVLVAAVAWRPHGWGPTLGALAAAALAALGGTLELDDVGAAARAQWQAFVTLAAVMTMTAAAGRIGLLDRLAARIEPYTRGPVKRAFAVTFVISVGVSAVLSNDAAILLLTPTVIHLLRTVYPVRHPKFVVPFAIAVFAAAGVAPLVISNPMNLIFAQHVGIGFNAYTATMAPVALAGWVTTYVVLRWMFRDALADTAPALGAWPHRPAPLRAAELAVLAAIAGVLLLYPVMSYLGLPLWPVAAAGGALTATVCLAAGQSPRELAGGVAWTVFPFLIGVFLLATALGRIGVVDWLHELYAGTAAPTATIGISSAIGSAVLNNHPMSVLNAFALEGLADPTGGAFAALVGGNLGPRLLPVGSLAALLWYDLLRKHDVQVRMTTFIRAGILLTAPPLAISLLLLWLLHM